MDNSKELNTKVVPIDSQTSQMNYKDRETSSNQITILEETKTNPPEVSSILVKKKEIISQRIEASNQLDNSHEYVKKARRLQFNFSKHYPANGSNSDISELENNQNNQSINK